MLLINHSLFLLRDNAIIIKDLHSDTTKHVFYKQRVHSLMKVKTTSGGDNGFKSNTYKVVVVCKNGSLGSITPQNLELMTDWERQPDQTQTPMFLSKDEVQHTFQNQNTLKNVYVVCRTVGNEQKIYQVTYDLQTTELKIKMAVSDLAFNVLTTSR